MGSFLLLANPDERFLSDFRVQYNSEAEKTITNVPVQANYVTNINGKFSENVNQQFVIFINDTWASAEKEVDYPPYLTFSAESTQTFNMELINFTLGAGEYFEYAVGDGNWTQFTSEVSNISFGGNLGELRLRGKSSKGTAIDNGKYSKISFGDANVKVSCRGDIRTLVDYKDYETTSTANAGFTYLFQGCTALTTAPVLPATTLADHCYRFMFMYCTGLSEVKMLAMDVSATDCLSYWLTSAGTNATSRTLTLSSQSIYNEIKNNVSYLPNNWSQGQATIQYTNP